MTVDVFYPERHDLSKIAFVFHGRNGTSDSPHLCKMIEPYLIRGYLVVSPNLRNSDWNDSAGTGKGFLISTHIQDCKRTIEWAKESHNSLGWQGKGIALCGHSMGGYAAAFLAATTYNSITEHVLAVAPFTDGVRHILNRGDISVHPGGIQSLKEECPFSLTEWPQHSIYTVIDKLHMPVTVAVGTDDTLTTPQHVRAFYDALPNRADMLVLENEHHCLVGESVPKILSNCIGRLEDLSIVKPQRLNTVQPKRVPAP